MSATRQAARPLCSLLQHFRLADTRALSTSVVTNAKVGFIGLGNMGFPMASNLLQAGGHELVVCDSNTDAVERLCAQHSAVSAAATPSDVALTPGVKAIITMLPSPAAVLQVYCGAQGLLSVPLLAPLLIDCSTIDPATARQVAATAGGTPLGAGVGPLPGMDTRPGGSPAVVDAPVSGGVPGATAGTLTFMVGGPDAAVAEALPLLRVMGSRVLQCGGPGAGQAAKMCNNLVLGISMAAVAEGLALGKQLGLHPALLTSVFNSSSARCWSSESYNPCPGVMEGVPASRGYRGGFGAGLMVKDLTLASEAAAAAGAALPLGRRARALYKQVADVDSTLDFTSVFQHVFDGVAHEHDTLRHPHHSAA